MVIAIGDKEVTKAERKEWEKEQRKKLERFSTKVLPLFVERKKSDQAIPSGKRTSLIDEIMDSAKKEAINSNTEESASYSEKSMDILMATNALDTMPNTATLKVD